jgi:hypothetical protein
MPESAFGVASENQGAVAAPHVPSAWFRYFRSPKALLATESDAGMFQNAAEEASDNPQYSLMNSK